VIHITSGYGLAKGGLRFANPPYALTTGLLPKEASFRFIVTGKIGVKEKEARTRQGDSGGYHLARDRPMKEAAN
jgi:hypothetical protein